MLYFTDEALAQMRAEFATVPQKLVVLQDRYLRGNFQNDRARELAHNGYVRRLNILARCIENLFALIPPDRTEPVERDVRRDAEIQIQTSVFNVFGAADNLAWIWVNERGTRRPNGAEIPNGRIGLRPTNEEVRASLPQAVRDHIAGFDAWFDMVDNYRHALAHRIPLYIPPFMVDPAEADRHQALDQAKNAALLAGNLVEHQRLREEQKTLEFFRPWMQHSFGEQARPLVFHPQLLANFNTVEDLGRTIADALGI